MEIFKKYLIEQHSLLESEWDIICTYCKVVHIPKNTYLIESGRVASLSGFILEGVMRYFAIAPDGTEPTCYFSFESHYIVDPFSFPTQTPSTINLKTVTDCTIIEIGYDRHLKILAELPRWKDIVNAMLLQVSIEFANQKTMVSLNAAERYDYFLRHYSHIALRSPLQYIASYLGIAQPSLSRVRKRKSARMIENID